MGSGAAVRVSRYAAAVALGCLGLLAAAGPGWAEPNGPAASTPTTTPAPPASGGQVTVTSSCAGGNETVTVHNGTDAPVPVLVTNFGQRFDQFTVAAAAEHSFVLTAAGAPYDITAVRGDTAVVLFTLSGFPCPSRIDRSFTVTAGSTFTSPEICPPPLLSVTRGPAHGTVRSVAVGNGVGFRYTPAAGFRGSDSFDYQCGTSANQFGTIRLTVVAAAATTTPAPAPAPIPAPSPTTTAPAPQPSTALPATGPSRLPAQLGTGAALLLLGSAAVWFGRRRRSPAGG